MHDWCGTFHFHTFKRSLLALVPNRPSGLCSSKPVMELAFLVGLCGTRVALFCGGGTSADGWDSTPVFAPYPIIESCMLFWAQGTKCLTHEELGGRILAPSLMWLGSLKTCGSARQGADILQNIWLSKANIRNGRSTSSSIVAEALLVFFTLSFKFCLHFIPYTLQQVNKVNM